MAFVKGQAPGPGRPKGAKNKKDEIVAELTKQAIEAGLLPLDFFLSNLRNDNMPLGFRYENAKAAAPYVHRKMPIAIENADAPFKVLDMSMLAGLTDEELALVDKLMTKAQQRALDEHERENRQHIQPRAPKRSPKPEATPEPTVDTSAPQPVRTSPAKKIVPKAVAKPWEQ